MGIFSFPVSLLSPSAVLSIQCALHVSMYRPVGGYHVYTGRFLTSTVQRKLLLKLNAGFWDTALPELFGPCGIDNRHDKKNAGSVESVHTQPHPFCCGDACLVTRVATSFLILATTSGFHFCNLALKRHSPLQRHQQWRQVAARPTRGHLPTARLEPRDQRLIAQRQSWPCHPMNQLQVAEELP